MIPLPSRRALLLLAFAAVAVAALVARRAPWSADDFRDLRDSVAEHERLALSPGHAALLDSGQAGCTVCHISHNAQERRPLWGGERMTGGTEFVTDSLGGGGGKTGMCLSCHDGVTARPLTAHAPAPGTLSEGGAGLGSAHPVGVDYAAAARRMPDSFVDPALNPRIVLEDGRIGCVSCHATHDAASASASSVRHEVCVECHRR